jgi:hypothetical protein
MVCPRHRLFLCGYCQLVFKGLVRFCGSLDCEAFSCHQGMEYRLLGACLMARFSPTEGRGVALVKFYAQANMPCAHLPIPSFVA